MSRIAAFVLAANLLALTALTFIYPHLMAGPGLLIAGHQQLEADCFACHAPFGGSSSARCAVCHKPEDIGKVNTKGVPIVKQTGAVVTFHQKLTRQDCVACHSDHAGARRYRPEGRFSHSLLEPAVRDACTGCHKAPQDKTHKEFAGACTSCHTMTKWKPAVADHAKFFVLDGNHHQRCSTCHVRNTTSAWTCYTCHAHTPDKVRQEHTEVATRDIGNCIDCHRSANKRDSRKDGQKGREGN